MSRGWFMTGVMAGCAAACLLGGIPVAADGDNYDDMQVNDDAMSESDQNVRFPDAETNRGDDADELRIPDEDLDQDSATNDLDMQEQKIEPLPLIEDKPGAEETLKDVQKPPVERGDGNEQSKEAGDGTKTVGGGEGAETGVAVEQEAVGRAEPVQVPASGQEKK